MEPNIEAILTQCFFAAGQGAGNEKRIDFDAIVWWRHRYRAKFLFALTEAGNSWEEDCDRVLAVSRWLGQRASVHAVGRRSIDADAAVRAAGDVESGCRMNKQRSQ